MEENLAQSLNAKREELRLIPTPSGRTPLVCTDEALKELARLRPKKKSELLYVPGLGKAFVEKYGDEFMQVLDAYHAKRAGNKEIMRPTVREKLKNLEARLVNINRRNRLLYMPKLSAKYAVDLVDKEGGGALLGFKVVDLLKRQDDKAKLKILDIKEGDEKESKKRFEEFRTLEREAERARRESGEATLHVGYPFVQGRLSGEDFTVRAPLVLFPAKIEIADGCVYLQLEPDKDVVYNSALILSHFKFSGKNDVVEDNIVEDLSRTRFTDELVEYFANYGMEMRKPKTSDVKKFVSYTAATFPKYKRGEFEIFENAVIGRFSLYSGALQQDFRRIVESDFINENLDELLGSDDDTDIYSDSEEIGDAPDIMPPTERGLNYINDLNISQENAIYNINNLSRLVVQGPPGTGKSQVITGMIADFVNKGKNVLMVSQKKAALDVIYSRLGKLSRYAVMIGDTKDKETFYDGLSRLFATGKLPPYDMRKFDTTSDRVDEGLARLDRIAEKMYFEEPYGAPMQYIYGDNLENRFIGAKADKLDAFAYNICLELCNFDYDEILEIRDYLDNNELLSAAKEFYELSENFPWLPLVRDDLNSMDITHALEDAERAVDEYVKYKSKGFFGRLFGGGEYKKSIRYVTGKYFGNCDKRTVKLFEESPTELYNGLKNFDRHRTLRLSVNSLTDRQKLYFGCLYNVYKERGGSLVELNRELKDYIAYRAIAEFENANRDILAQIDTFDITVRDIFNLLRVKRTESANRMKITLINEFADYIDAGKHKSDMLKVVESKRKQSIRRFVDKYKFWLFKGVKVWLMTPEAVSEVLPLEDGLFDLVIFDEASQIYIERGVPAIARAKKVVIAGDHKQLRPSSLGDGRIEADEDADDDENVVDEESLLDLARFRFPEVLLDYHYRSKYEELISFSNYAFYKGRLNVSPNTETPAEPPISVKKVKNGLWEDRRNLAEAKEVVKIVSAYLADENRTDTLGVITFNSSQRDLVQDLLDKECSKNSAFATAYLKEVNRNEKGEDIGLFVKNIENVQGDERDVIIFSVAYAKNESGKVVRNYGWLNRSGGENRLNVAVSRAKKKIHIVTSITPDELKVDDLKNDGPRIFRKYLEYAYAVSGGNDDAAKSVLTSLSSAPPKVTLRPDNLAVAVWTELVKAGLNVERDVGMGSYKIDLALKDADGRYILGIECDSNLYSRLPSARERDIHRARYLECRGWKLYRVWSEKWWHDPKAQVEEIKAAFRERIDELDKEKRN